MGIAKSLVGIDGLHYALLTADTSSAATWAAAVALLGVTEVATNPNASVETLFADNGPAITANSIGEIEVSIKLADLTPEEKAILLGHTRTGGVTIYNGADVSPEVAIGFKSVLSDGTLGYAWLLKGRFVEVTETIATKGNKTTFQLATLTGKFVLLAYNGDWKRTTRSDDTDYVAATGTNWFTNGPLGSTDAAAPTVTVAPTDTATDQAATVNIVWTFNEAIQASDVTAANFFAIKADGTPVPGALTVDTDHKIVTLNPTDPLTAGADYISICTTGVHDLAGNALAANCVASFGIQA